MFNNTPPFGPRSLRWPLLWLLAQVILIGASPTPAAKAINNALIDKRADHRKLYPQFEQTYLGRVEKGYYFLELLPLGNQEAQEVNRGVSVISPFQDYKALERWGWRPSVSRYPYDSNLVGNTPVVPAFTGNMDDVFKDPVLPVDETANIAYFFDNDMPFKKQRLLPSVEPSDGSYKNAMNPKSGAIMFDVNWSPKYKVAENGRGNIPDLNALSDVVFFQWLHACKIDKVDPKKLKVAYQLSIETESTIKIIEQALRQANHKLISGWNNKKVFTMEETGGAAILGSLHGGTIAWLLIQHKDILGIKTITEVAVWKNTGRSYYNLRFTMKDA
ncbi:hypothetical protein LZ30DRAFT_692100 [Colletotrichum cereale]|nr:hypothetical protein LZ30DRAFT_692100 [Colletotrichum cereale]